MEQMGFTVNGDKEKKKRGRPAKIKEDNTIEIKEDIKEEVMPLENSVEKKPLRFVHFSDNHIGFSRFKIYDSDGINVRQKDFENAFMESIEKILQIKPDFIINSGDIFEKGLPPIRSQDVVATGLNALSGIPTIILGGTHDVPKMRRDQHVYSLLKDKIDNLYVCYEPEEIKLEDLKVVIHCVPYSTNFVEMTGWFIDAVDRKKDRDYKHILVIHNDVKGVHEFRFSTKALDITKRVMDEFDYIAAGHLHSFSMVDKMVFAGATERTKFDESFEPKYVLEVELTNDIKIIKHELNIRPMKRFFVDLTKINDVVIAKQTLMDEIEKEIDDKSMLNFIIDASFDIKKSINLIQIEQWAMVDKGSFCTICGYAEDKQEENRESVNVDVGGNILDEWTKKVNSLNEEKEIKKWLYDKGKFHLEKEMEKVEDYVSE